MKHGYKTGRLGPFWGYVAHGSPWQSDWSMSLSVVVERTLLWTAYLAVTVGYWRVAIGLSILKDEKQAVAIRSGKV